MARRIDTQAEIDWIRLADQVGDPASPAAGYKYFYAKAGGLYAINSAGAVVGPFVMTTVATDPIFDAAGDIVQGTGANTADRLAIGTAYQQLRVNSGATALEYNSSGRFLISEQTPTGTTVTWNSIPATFNHLIVEFVARSDKAAVTAEIIYLYFNNDTTATNYYRGSLTAENTGTSVSEAEDNLISLVTAANAPASNAGIGSIFIPYYAKTTFNKSALAQNTYRDATTVSSTRVINLHWESAVAITRVDIVTATAGNFVAGSTFRLYGVF